MLAGVSGGAAKTGRPVYIIIITMVTVIMGKLAFLDVSDIPRVGYNHHGAVDKRSKGSPSVAHVFTNLAPPHSYQVKMSCPLMENN